MKLTNPTDEQLNEAFAVHVAGWKLWPRIYHNNQWHDVPTWVAPPFASKEDGIAPAGQLLGASCPKFTASAEAVMPWLEKAKSTFPCSDTRCDSSFDGKQWCVSIAAPSWDDDSFFGEGKSFPRAAVIALLRAHGVEIEFTE